MRETIKRCRPGICLFHVVRALPVVLLFSAPAIAGEMHLPALPNLPAFSSEYETSGKTADAPEEMLDAGKLDSVSRPAEATGTPGPDTEGVKANKRKIDYGAKTKSIGSRISGMSAHQAGGDQEAGGQPGLTPVTVTPSPGLALGFGHRTPELGRIGFERDYRGNVYTGTPE